MTLEMFEEAKPIVSEIQYAQKNIERLKNHNYNIGLWIGNIEMTISPELESKLYNAVLEHYQSFEALGIQQLRLL